jgi:T5SS/PEP-CTERM-associated repeat protein
MCYATLGNWGTSLVIAAVLFFGGKLTALAEIVVTGATTPYPSERPDPWICSCNLVVNAGSLTINQGSDIISSAATFGTGTGGTWTVLITGLGSTWTTPVFGAGVTSSGTMTITDEASAASDYLVVGGGATLTVESGGKLETEIFSNITQVSDEEGTVTVTGDGSRWTIHDRLNIGSSAGGRGFLTVDDLGIVEADKIARIWQNGEVVLTGQRRARIVVGANRVGLSDPANSSNQFVIMPAGDGFVAGKVELRGGRIEADEVRLVGNSNGPTINADVYAQLDGRGTIIGNLHNQGRIVVNGAYTALSYGPGVTAAQLYVDGDYHQSADSNLTVQLTDANRSPFIYDGPYYPYSTGSFPLFVERTAHLNGELHLDRAGTNVERGDVFDLVRYGSIDGRFTKVTGTVIDDEKFFGLRYGSDRLQAVVLETPRRPGPGAWRMTTNGTRNNLTAANLILVTHGWDSMAGELLGSDGNEWKPIIAFQEPSVAVGAWDGVVFDWSQMADTFLPEDAASRAIDVGESLGFWLDEVGLGYANAHIIGHSAGSWLADALVTRLEESGRVGTSHLTLVDGFTPPEVVKYGMAGSEASNQQIGASADWADHFVDFRNAYLNQILHSTNENLPYIFTIDVTMLDPMLSFGDHGSIEANRSWVNENTPVAPSLAEVSRWHRWPGEFYASALDPNSAAASALRGIGVSTGFLGTQGGTPIGQNVRAVLDPFGWTGFYERGDLIDVIFSSSNSIVSEPGTVEFDGDGGFTLTADSAAYITSFVEVDSPVNVLEFDFHFVSGAQSLLSIYVDDSLVFSFDQSFSPPDWSSSGGLWLETLQPGIHSLLFRLDPGEMDDLASVSIADITLSNLSLVQLPELPGDFNTDGAVDAADYVVWRKNGGTQADFDLWRANFGRTADSETMPGDFNEDGTVDAADYVVWRRNNGTQAEFNTWRANFGRTTESGLMPGDFNSDGTVDAADYVVWRRNNGTQSDFNTWRSNFGRTRDNGSGSWADSASETNVPEPASAILVLLGLPVVAMYRQNRAGKE